MEVRENVPLASLTTLGVGGDANFFVRAGSVCDVEEAVAFSKGKKLPLFVLGGGSNLVISDRRWNGRGLQIGIPGIDDCPQQNKTLFEACAGRALHTSVAHI